MKHILFKFKERTANVFESFDGLWNIFLDIWETGIDGELYCIIDALDECGRESQDEILNNTLISPSFWPSSDMRAVKDIMIRLLDPKRGDVKIAPDAAATICRCFDAETIQLLLECLADQVGITHLLWAAAGNEIEGEKVMRMLLHQGRDIEITEDVVKNVVRNIRADESQIMNLLLDRYGSDYEITEEILTATTININYDGMMRLLLDRCGGHIGATEKILRIEILLEGTEVIGLLADRFRGHGEITQDFVDSVRSEMDLRLLHNQEDEIDITLDEASIFSTRE